jgi:hypothetical protein
VLEFSPQNNKTRKLAGKRFARKWLRGRKVYSLDLLSGWACPFAKECKSRAVKIDGKFRIKDGPHCKFRCFSASQEARLYNVYRRRKHNFDLLRKAKTKRNMVKLLREALPKDTGLVRIHVGGDFFSQNYFDAWIELAESRPDILFYAYTKALAYWVNRKDRIPANLVLTASHGGIFDELIKKYNLRSAKVVLRPHHARKVGLPIDQSDSIAANPSRRRQCFALLLHGPQPSGEGARLVAARR